MFKNYFIIFHVNVIILQPNIQQKVSFHLLSFFFSFFSSFFTFFLSFFFSPIFLLSPFPAYKVWSLPTSAACRIADIVGAWVSC